MKAAESAFIKELSEASRVSRTTTSEAAGVKPLERDGIIYGQADTQTGEISIDIAATRQAFKTVFSDIAEGFAKTIGRTLADLTREEEKKLESRFTGFAHAHEIFHQLIAKSEIKLDDDIEEALADIFAKQSFGLDLELEEQAAVEAFKEMVGRIPEKTLSEGIKKQLELQYFPDLSPEALAKGEGPPKEGKVDFFFNLHKLGIPFDNVSLLTPEQNTADQNLYRIDTVTEILNQFGISERGIEQLYGDMPGSFRGIHVLVLSPEALEMLENNTSIPRPKGYEKYPFTERKGLALNSQDELLAYIKKVLGLKEALYLPVVVLSEDASMVVASHELSHVAYKTTWHHGPRTGAAYYANPDEKMAFLISILAFRNKYHKRTFFDFLRMQECAGKKEFPDWKIRRIIEEGNNKSLLVEQALWDAVSARGKVTVGNIRGIKNEVFNEAMAVDRIRALRQRDLAYGLKGGALSNPKINPDTSPWYQAYDSLLQILLRNGFNRNNKSEWQDAERLAEVLSKMKNGALEILCITGVITEAERDVFRVKNDLFEKEERRNIRKARQNAMLRFSAQLAALDRNAERELTQRLKKIVDSYNDNLTKRQKRLMMTRLMPVRMANLLAAAYKCSPSRMLDIITNRPDLPVWLYDAAEKVDAIYKKGVRGRTNAWTIVFNQGIGKTDAWVEKGMRKVAILKEKVKKGLNITLTDSQVWETLIQHSIEKCESWTDDAVVLAKSLEDDIGVGGYRNAWIIVKGQGLDQALSWTEGKVSFVNTIVQNNPGLGRAEAWLITVGHGKNAKAWVKKAREVVDRIRPLVGNSYTNAWTIVIDKGITESEIWVDDMRKEHPRLRNDRKVGHAYRWARFIKGENASIGKGAALEERDLEGEALSVAAGVTETAKPEESLYKAAERVIPEIVDIMRKGAPTYALEPSSSEEDVSPVLSYLRKTEQRVNRKGHKLFARTYVADKNWVEKITDEGTREGKMFSDLLSDFAKETDSRARFVIRLAKRDAGGEEKKKILAFVKNQFSKHMSQAQADTLIETSIRIVEINIGKIQHLNTTIDLITDVTMMECDRYAKGQYTDEIPEELKDKFLYLLRLSIDNFEILAKDVNSFENLLQKIFSGFTLRIKAINWEGLRAWKRAQDKVLQAL